MSAWRFLHVIALFWMMAGIGSTMVPIWRAWAAETIEEKALLLTEAQRGETFWLLPGMIAVLFSGYAWAAAADLNVITTGWLLALQVLTLVDLFIFLPLMGVGLRRVRVLALQSRKRGGVSDELRDALADNVPVVFATVIAVSVPVMAWLPIVKPF